MSIEQEILDRYYQAAFFTKDEKSFFLLVADYIEYATNTSLFAKPIQNFIKERAKDYKEVNDIEKRVINEVKQTKAEIDKIITENQISSDELDRLLFAYESWIKGTSTGSESLGNNLYTALSDILFYFEREHKDKILHFISERKVDRPLTHHFNFAPSLYDYSEAKDKLEYRRITNFWEAWNNLATIHLIIYNGYTHLAELKKEAGVNGSKNVSKMWEAYNFSFVLGEAKHVFDKYSEKRDIRALFDRKDIEGDFIRIHSNLIAHVDKDKTSSSSQIFKFKKGSEVKTPSRKILPDEGKGGYLYEGKKIEIAQNTIAFKVFDILYKNLNQKNFVSYKTIENKLREYGEKAIEDESKRNKRINNAILNEKQGFFRFAKINGQPIKNESPSGEKLIVLQRGEGLILNI